MTIIDGTHFLELKVIWKEGDMCQLSIRVSNGRYHGTTEVYISCRSLTDFATSLSGYPRDYKSLLYEAGQKNSYSYFSMKFYRVDRAGYHGL